jgi:hypothetical protein
MSRFFKVGLWFPIDLWGAQSGPLVSFQHEQA